MQAERIASWMPFVFDWEVFLYGIVATVVVCFLVIPAMVLVVRRYDVEGLMLRAVRECARKMVE